MPRFNVGDRVHVVEDTQRAPGALRGQGGTVTEVTDPGAGPEEVLYTVRFEGSEQEIPVYESALEAGASLTGLPTLRDRIIEYEVNSGTVFGDDVPLDELDDPISTAGWDRFRTTVSTHNTRDSVTEPTRRAHWEVKKAALAPTAQAAARGQQGVTRAQVVSALACTRCGVQNRAGAAFCANCGNALGPPRRAMSRSSESEDEDVVGRGRYLLSFLLAGFIGLGIQYALRRKGWMATAINVPIGITALIFLA